MTELTREEKIKIFEKLPKELQNLMESEDTGAFLLYLGEKYDLDDDKVSLLSKLVGDVVLGIMPITSLAQEINLKIATDSQVAMNLAQELYANLLSPVMSATKPLSVPQISIPSPIPMPIPPTDKYLEPTNGAPGIVDLRRMPPAVSKIEPLSPPAISRVEPPPAIKVEPLPPRPLTFTKPVEPIKPKPATPLIEAEPHKMSAPPPSKISPRETLEGKPQYIIRPPGLAPTDLPRNILDLKKDKGEF